MSKIVNAFRNSSSLGSLSWSKDSDGKVVVSAEMLDSPENVIAEVKRNYKGSIAEYSGEKIKIVEKLDSNGKKKISLTAKII